MLSETLSGFKVVLGSNSPRRKELLKELIHDFEIRTQSSDEVFPKEITEGNKIAEFLANLKADALISSLERNELLITADTIVWQNGEVLAKPLNQDHAFEMIQSLSGKSHEVITGVCIATNNKRETFSATTTVEFGDLNELEIKYYINSFKPFDKAGAYGIQEWIGFVGVKSINGSYNNVVGLPTYELYHKLIDFIQNK